MKDKEKPLDKITKDYKKMKSIKKVADKHGLSYSAVYSKLYRRNEIDVEEMNIKNTKTIKNVKGKINLLYIPKYHLQISGLQSDPLKATFKHGKNKLSIEIENYD